MGCLMKQWEARETNAFCLLNEEVGMLKKQKHESKLKELEILEENMFEGDNYAKDKRNVSIHKDDYGFEEITSSSRKDI